MTDPIHDLKELKAEAGFGGEGELIERAVPLIDMADLFTRKAEITEDLWQAATGIGFFQLTNHGTPEALIDEAFRLSAEVFALAPEAKAQYPLKPGTNAGWEYKAQVRPSTGTADQKESFQVTLPRMAGLWPTGAEVPGFKATMLAFERMNWALAMTVLSCFADRLGFAPDAFTEAHDPGLPEYQSTLRLIHYSGMEDALLFGDGGCTSGRFPLLAGRGAYRFRLPDPAAPADRPGRAAALPRQGRQGPRHRLERRARVSGIVTCNIGDMLMRWSDDRLLSTLHRVRMPNPGEPLGARQSIAFFAQANTDVVLQGPGALYPPITAHDYIQMRLGANFRKA